MGDACWDYCKGELLPETVVFDRVRSSIRAKRESGMRVPLSIRLELSSLDGKRETVFVDTAAPLSLTLGELKWWLCDDQLDADAKPPCSPIRRGI